MTPFKRYYPSSESILINRVKVSDLYDYINEGFIIPTDTPSIYFSACPTKTDLIIPRNSETDEVFRQKDDTKDNIRGLNLLLSQLMIIKFRKAKDPNLYILIQQELNKREYKGTINNFRETIGSILSIQFPDYTFNLD